ncbi:alpha/beta hydrolase [Maritimibacter sp. UBA3975]|uniref:alpha/beta fold hydrolase n=1 Tax=Maritimibacter sp. UBA3975 TaxID=1946833 RepID=UPI0025C3779A|nr:alpha/beta hydrolase [Maritimibacter sp. UBA3975]|tara:strand:- start:76075 stop:76749 length:675 start_codon:yes stop_codon:yes gene_type:complete
MTILLIPGLLCDAYCWQPVTDRIEAEVADLSSQDSISRMADDCLKAYAGTLQVAGHSMGARVAMEMARMAPDRVERLALLDTGIHPLKDGEAESRRELVEYAYEHGMEALAARWLPPMVYEPNRTKALMDGLTEMVLRSDEDQHARQIKALVNRPDASAYLPDIRCETLVMVGRQDEWSPVSRHERMLELLPNARLEVIEDAGHFAPLEQPETVADLLVPFLKG